VLRQHLRTDKLLGVDAVPAGRPKAVHVHAATAGVSHQATTKTEVSSVAKRTPKAKVQVGDKAGQLAAMDLHEVKTCNKCGLCEGRTNTVFGEGDPDAKLMFIGEGPGQTEDELGRPFVGRAGELLDKMIVAMGLQREQVYIANVVKCRPPNNRTPQPDEAAKCIDYLFRQIAIIQPQVIVTLGLPAARAMLGNIKGITAIRGTWHEFQDVVGGGATIPVMPTFHPAYILRAYTPDNRKKVWSDLQQAMQRLGLKT